MEKGTVTISGFLFTVQKRCATTLHHTDEHLYVVSQKLYSNQSPEYNSLILISNHPSVQVLGLDNTLQDTAGEWLTIPLLIQDVSCSFLSNARFF